MTRVQKGLIVGGVIAVVVGLGAALWLRGEMKRRADCRATEGQASVVLLSGDIAAAEALRPQLWDTCRDTSVMADFDSRLSRLRERANQ